MPRFQGLRLVSPDWEAERQRAARLAALEAKHSKERARERRDFWLFWIAVSLSYAGAYWLAVKLTEWVTA